MWFAAWMVKELIDVKFITGDIAVRKGHLSSLPKLPLARLVQVRPSVFPHKPARVPSLFTLSTPAHRIEAGELFPVRPGVRLTHKRNVSLRAHHLVTAGPVVCPATPASPFLVTAQLLHREIATAGTVVVGQRTIPGIYTY